MQSIVFLILFVSGIGTMLGGFLCCYVKQTHKNFAIGLSFFAGIMIYMSLADVLKKAEHIFLKLYSQNVTNWFITLLFCISLFLVVLIDIFLNKINKKIVSTDKQITFAEINKTELIKVILFSLISITLHNIPEGLYVYIVSGDNLKIFYSVILPMILHNILEGLAIAFPIYYLVGDKCMVAICSFLCGICEICGLLFITLLSKAIINYHIFCFLVVFSSVMMLYIAFNKMIFLARKYGNDEIVFRGIFIGILFMMIITNITPNITSIFLQLYQ